MNNLIKILYLFLFLSYGCQKSGPIKDSVSNEGHSAFIEDKQSIIKGFTIPELPSELYFAGERIPLENSNVRERLQRELVVHAYRHGRMLITLSEKSMWEGHIRQVLKDNEVSEDFFYLAIAESELEPEIVSHSGAVGIWQIMEQTGKEYGMIINDYIDQRRDPIKSTEFACEYLKKAKSKFGKWTLAAISYNRGMNGLSRAIDNQKVSLFHDLYLNKESSRYLFRILALKVIFSDPEKYGFIVNENQRKTSAKIIAKPLENGEYDVIDLAKKYGLTYKELRLLNPWLIDAKRYKLKVKAHGVNLLIVE